MAINRVRKFTTIFELQTFLNGGLVGAEIKGAQGGGTPGNLGAGFNGLVGKTLIFASPVIATVTFVTADGAGGSAEPGVGTNPDKNTLLFKDLKLQIEAAVPTVKVTAFGDRIVFLEAAPSLGVSINKTGTANAILGIDTAQVSTNFFYKTSASATPPVAPFWMWVESGNDNMYTVLTVE